MIKNYIQENSLTKAHHANQRAVLMTNFDSIKTIGFLSNPKKEIEIIEIAQIIKQFEKYDKQIFPLIYFSKKIEGDISLENMNWTGFGKEDCNWFGKPKKKSLLNRFTNQEFDLLIDLSFTNNYSLQSIFVQSKAQLKVMPTNDFSKQFADLMLETPTEQSKLAFTKELIHYLEIINKKPQ